MQSCVYRVSGEGGCLVLPSVNQTEGWKTKDMRDRVGGQEVWAIAVCRPVVHD